MVDFIDFTLFDIFWKNNDIYLVLSINNEEVNENDLNVSVNNINLVLKKKIIKKEKWSVCEPVLIFIYDDNNFNENELLVNITYKYKPIPFNYSKKIEKFCTKYNSNLLCLTTLFKDDYDLFPNYYKYYKKQGVQHFFMYYNGLLNDKIKEIFNYDDVTLIEWDFRYWNDKEKHKYKHHAQPGQMHHALYKYGKDNYKYMIFNDLDEYLFIPNIKLIDYIKSKSNVTVFGFKNIWAETYDGNKEIQESLYVDKILDYPNRSKNIYMTSAIETLYIHKPDKMLVEGKKNIRDLNNIVYHFSSWTGGHGVIADGGKKREYKKFNNLRKINLDFLN
tara:strand:+ start:420 stop:1418 length:999 start_codon:yes stop_codon:yes gene_type:complete